MQQNKKTATKYKKLLDNKSIEASLMEHAGKLHRWHIQPKIDRSTVLKAATEYGKQENCIPYNEFKNMLKVQRTLIWGCVDVGGGWRPRPPLCL